MAVRSNTSTDVPKSRLSRGALLRERLSVNRWTLTAAKRVDTKMTDRETRDLVLECQAGKLSYRYPTLSLYSGSFHRKTMLAINYHLGPRQTLIKAPNHARSAARSARTNWASPRASPRTRSTSLRWNATVVLSVGMTVPAPGQDARPPYRRLPTIRYTFLAYTDGPYDR